MRGADRTGPHRKIRSAKLSFRGRNYDDLADLITIGGYEQSLSVKNVGLKPVATRKNEHNNTFGNQANLHSHRTGLRRPDQGFGAPTIKPLTYAACSAAVVLSPRARESAARAA